MREMIEHLHRAPVANAAANFPTQCRIHAQCQHVAQRGGVEGGAEIERIHHAAHGFPEEEPLGNLMEFLACGDEIAVSVAVARA